MLWWIICAVIRSNYVSWLLCIIVAFHDMMIILLLCVHNLICQRCVNLNFNFRSSKHVCTLYLHQALLKSATCHQPSKTYQYEIILWTIKIIWILIIIKYYMSINYYYPIRLPCSVINCTPNVISDILWNTLYTSKHTLLTFQINHIESN